MLNQQSPISNLDMSDTRYLNGQSSLMVSVDSGAMQVRTSTCIYGLFNLTTGKARGDPPPS